MSNEDTTPNTPDEETTEPALPTPPPEVDSEPKKDFVEESLKIMQDKINSVECWDFISKSNTFLSQARKEKYVKLGVYDKIADEIKEFATEKAKQIASGSTSVGVDFGNKDGAVLTPFTPNEVKVLKSLVLKVSDKITSSSTVSQDPPTPTLAPYQHNNGATNYPKRRGNRKAQRVGEDGFPIIGSPGHRTSIHDSLEIISNELGNDPAPYSSVNILDVDKQSKRATIEFTGRESSGVRATIDICDLVGFEDI